VGRAVVPVAPAARPRECVAAEMPLGADPLDLGDVTLLASTHTGTLEIKVTSWESAVQIDAGGDQRELDDSWY
jgi:hypothetical protein